MGIFFTMAKYFFEILLFLHLTLRQFFKNRLSRKAEGLARRSLDNLFRAAYCGMEKGANSITQKRDR